MFKLVAATCVFLFSLTSAQAAETPAAQAGIALHGDTKYAEGFAHFEYASPDAVKGGEVRLASIGTFDSLNPYILSGLPAAGSDMVFETLMAQSLDEPFSQYGWIAETVTVAPDRSWVSYQIRPQARFHDGAPITPEDVLFSFEILRDKGHPFYRSYYKDVVKAEAIGTRGVKFTFNGKENTELPLIMGQLPVLAKHFWNGKKFEATTLTPILGSGPYEIDTVASGRSITYKRVKNWWAKDLAINRGRFNFDTIRFDYYRDPTVTIEAFLAGRFDFRQENIAKYWATNYNTPAVQQKLIVKQEVKNELPSGMQGFVLNTRREIFKDPRVRQALAYVFDFEWGNKNVAYGSYERSASYFANSELAATGTPTSDELKILEPYRGKIPNEVFTTEYKPPVTDGSGEIRENMRKASELLRAAGWVPVNGKLVNNKGVQLKFEIVDSSPAFERWINPFIANLKRLGVEARFRVVDSSQHQNLVDNFDFDMIVHVFSSSLSPGNEMRDMWSSTKANQKGSRNVAGVNDPVVDALVEKIIHASNRETLVTLCRALDRVLLWNHYVIPHWHAPAWRLAYWDMFGQPEVSPKYGLGFPETWWVDQEKIKKIAPTQKRNR